MGFFGRLFPYSNLHDLNLDWIMQQISELREGSAEALAQILAQGISGTEFHWAATLDELIVRDAQDQELYRIKWDGDGFTLTQDGGTPLTYRVSNGTLTAPIVNGTVIRGGSAAITGEVTCGTITPSNPVDVAHGGTGATDAAAARTALGAMASDAVIPLAQGGTGATTAAAARTALGAMAADAIIPLAQGGTGATTAAAARTALGAMAADAIIPTTQGGTGVTTLIGLQQYIGLYSQTENTLSFAFPNLPNITNPAYKYAIVYGGDSTTAFCYMMWINVNNTSFTFFPMAQATSARTLTASYANDTLTITANATIYGGIRLIWFNS